MLGGDRDCCIIVGVDKSNYGFDTVVLSSNNSGGMIVYSNDANVLYAGRVHYLGKLNGQITMSVINENYVFPGGFHDAFISLDNKYLITMNPAKGSSKGFTINVYELNNFATEALQPVQSYTDSTGDGEMIFDLQGARGLSGSSSKITRFIRGVDTNTVVAIKYAGSYWYPTLGQSLSAGQGDVREGKSFIGWMGYPEIGTMNNGGV